MCWLTGRFIDSDPSGSFNLYGVPRMSFYLSVLAPDTGQDFYSVYRK